MAFLKPNEDIKIGRNPDISTALFVTVLNLGKYGQITLSSRGTNTFSAERIASMLKKLGIEEVKREDVIEDEQPTLKICLACPNNKSVELEDYIDLDFVKKI